jgi:hypothetical protein
MSKSNESPLVVTTKITADQFKKLQSEATSDPHLKFTIDPGLALRPELVHGSLDTPDALLGFSFLEPDLTITVLEVKSFLARHVSDKTLEEHILDLIKKYT